MKIINFMPPGAEVLMQGCVHISNYIGYASSYTLIAIVLKDYTCMLIS